MPKRLTGGLSGLSVGLGILGTMMTHILDKNGTKIQPGNQVRIMNERGDINRVTVAVDCAGVLRLRGVADGLMSTAKYYIDAIWWANDKPGNWLEVINDA
jgi:xanthine/uracil/vitamin C permease (AzgA family)